MPEAMVKKSLWLFHIHNAEPKGQLMEQLVLWALEHQAILWTETTAPSERFYSLALLHSSLCGEMGAVGAEVQKP